MPFKNTKLDTFIPYFSPYFAFLGIKAIADLFPNGLYLGYILAYVAAAALLWIFHQKYQEMHENKITSLNLFWALMVGVIGITIWILPYHYIANFAKTDGIFGLLGSRQNTIKLHHLQKSWLSPFILFRFIGYVLIVPIFEELFIRSFLWRFIINPDIEKVAIGDYTAFAFWGTAILFALSHNEWIVAFLYAVIINLFLIIKKDIKLCMVAHGFSNAILVIYVIISENWFLW